MVDNHKVSVYKIIYLKKIKDYLYKYQVIVKF